MSAGFGRTRRATKLQEDREKSNAVFQIVEEQKNEET